MSNSSISSSSPAMYIVMWEWDGVKPPGTFYRRIAEAGYQISKGQGKKVSPAQRRITRNSKIDKQQHLGAHLAFQEGVFITSVESVAYYVRNLAVDFGATNVFLSEGTAREHYSRTPEDSAVINRVESVIGHKGPLPKAKDWVVSCQECLMCGHVHAYSPTKCTHCPGMYILSRPGLPEVHKDPGGPIIEAWARSRFKGTHWEPVEWKNHGTTPPPLKHIKNMQLTARDRDLLQAMFDNPPAVAHLDREEAIVVLDAIFAGIRRVKPDTRISKRSLVAVNYFQLGGEPGKFPFLTPATGGDIVDAGLILEPERVAKLMLFT